MTHLRVAAVSNARSRQESQQNQRARPPVQRSSQRAGWSLTLITFSPARSRRATRSTTSPSAVLVHVQPLGQYRNAYSQEQAQPGQTRGTQDRRLSPDRCLRPANRRQPRRPARRRLRGRPEQERSDDSRCPADPGGNHPGRRSSGSGNPGHECQNGPSLARRDRMQPWKS